VKRPSLIERAAGEIAIKAVVVASRLAIRRGDMHEAEHLAAMLLYGNNTHGDGTTCYLPDNFWDLARQFAEESRAYRVRRSASRS